MDFVVDYNRPFVVRETHVIPACWPAHRGLARKIAARYAHWITVFHTSAGTPAGATDVYTRTLAPFQDRVGPWLGPHAEACRAGQHPREWNGMTANIGEVAAAAEATYRRLADRVMDDLATTIAGRMPRSIRSQTALPGWI